MPSARIKTASSKTVDSKKAVRRAVAYGDYKALLAEAERALRSGATTTGNWSLGQIYEHLARGMDGSLDGVEAKRASIVVRLVARWIIKPRIFKHGMNPGFRLPTGAEELLVAGVETDNERAFEHLRRSIQRL